MIEEILHQLIGSLDMFSPLFTRFDMCRMVSQISSINSISLFFPPVLGILAKTETENGSIEPKGIICIMHLGGDLTQNNTPKV